MNVTQLESTARALVSPGRGILAADESDPTIGRRFSALGIENTAESRRIYRQMMFTTPGVAEFISGVILFDETIRQQADDGTPLGDLLAKRGMIPGNQGRQGDEGPRRRRRRADHRRPGRAPRAAGEYRGLGARFAKWRAVITIGPGIPTPYCVDTNAHALARYAALCQEAGARPDRRARGAHGRRPHHRALRRGHRGHAPHRLRRARPAAGLPGGDAAQAEHGRSPARAAPGRRVSRTWPRPPSAASGAPCRRRCPASCSSPAARATSWRRRT